MILLVQPRFAEHNPIVHAMRSRRPRARAFGKRPAAPKPPSAAKPPSHAEEEGTTWGLLDLWNKGCSIGSGATRRAFLFGKVLQRATPQPTPGWWIRDVVRPPSRRTLPVAGKPRSELHR